MITCPDLARMAEQMGVTLRRHTGGKKGWYSNRYRMISTRRGLTIAEYRSTLAHEIGHAIRGDIPTGTIFDQRAERAADHFAANLLITEEAYIESEQRHDGRLDPMAHDLGVTVYLLKTWRRLHERISQ